MHPSDYGWGMNLPLCCFVVSAITTAVSANGLELVPGGGYARIWAPFASSVRVAGDFNGWNINANVLAPSGNGWWEGGIAGPEAGDQYKFVIVNSGVTTYVSGSGDWPVAVSRAGLQMLGVRPVGAPMVDPDDRRPTQPSPGRLSNGASSSALLLQQ